MKVLLAGYNVDTDVLERLREKSGDPCQDVTPETFSAAYARISRDPRPIDEIRRDSRQEVERTRKSNETIIFKMGHHSVAEHAIFNFDIIGVSRYAMEAVEKFRLCSYTEKSQRYITLDNDFVVPEEIKGTAHEPAFRAMIQEQNALYHELYAKLRDYVFQKHSDLAQDPKKHNLLEGWAKEDARYVTALATEAQVGLTINARNLELMFRRFASHPLEEVRALGRIMYEKVKRIAPSIIIFHQANEYDQKTGGDLEAYVNKVCSSPRAHTAYDNGCVSLVQYDKDGDLRIGAALLHTVSGQSYETCFARVQAMKDNELKELFKTACQHMQFYDTLLREFEYAHLTYDVVMSSACYGQLKRHRMATITTQPYDPSLGITIPESISALGMDARVRALAKKAEALYEAIKKDAPHAAAYILMNCHQRRVLVRTNVRELFHMSRLREDAHAQWDIRVHTHAMSQAAHKVMPLACMLIGGKDTFGTRYEAVYGKKPRIIEAVLPGTRKID